MRRDVDSNGRKLGKVMRYAYVKTYGGAWLKVRVYSAPSDTKGPAR